MISRLVIFFWIFYIPTFLKNITAENGYNFFHQLDWMFDTEEAEDNNIVNENVSLCKTQQCQILANEFMGGMNTSVNPCDNFYNFVCGAWKNNDEIIPPYLPVWSRLVMFQLIIYGRVKDILEINHSQDDILPVRQAKKWYRSCMDTETLENRGLQPLESILMQAGGWPMVIDPEEWDEDAYSWQKIEHHYFEITGFYTFYVISLNRQSNFTAISIDRGPLPMNEKLASKYRDYKNDDYSAYVELIEGVAKMFIEYNRANVTEEMIKMDVQDLVEFEKKLHLLDFNNRKEKMFLVDFLDYYMKNITDLENEDKKIDKIRFQDVIDSVFELIDNKAHKMMVVHIKDPKYYIKLTELINNTPKRTIVNYIHWHFVSNMLDVTTEKMRDLFFKLMENEFDIKKRAPRWLECIKEMKMTDVISYMFVKKYFSKNIETRVRKMIDNICEELELNIEDSNWMDEITKSLLKEKLNSLIVQLGFPEWYNNKTAVINSQKGLIIGSDHFDNVLSFKRYEMEKKLRQNSKADQTTDIGINLSPITVNALYKFLDNEIDLPAAGFQPPLFTFQLPWYINYGMAGVSIGHEIGHGFDIIGITFGNNGTRTKIAKNMLKLYFNQAECFVDQYNSYYQSDKPKGTFGYYGMKTLGENIADSTGLYTVFKAYKKMIGKELYNDYRLPGFEEYTDDQMFFISFAATWCKQATSKFDEKLKKSDVHSPSNIRVIGAVSNSKDFANAFNCPEKSPMNPEYKCSLWNASNPPNLKQEISKSAEVY